MSEVFKGKVERIITKPTGKWNGAVFFISCEGGKDNFFNCSFGKLDKDNRTVKKFPDVFPASGVGPGDTVEIEWEQGEYGKEVVAPVVVVEKAAARPVAPDTPYSKPQRDGNYVPYGTVTDKDKFTQGNINFLSARGHALDAVKFMFDKEMFKEGLFNKRGVDKFDVFLTLVEEVTDRFFQATNKDVKEVPTQQEEEVEGEEDYE